MDYSSFEKVASIYEEALMEKEAISKETLNAYVKKGKNVAKKSLLAAGLVGGFGIGHGTAPHPAPSQLAGVTSPIHSILHTKGLHEVGKNLPIHSIRYTKGLRVVGGG